MAEHAGRVVTKDEVIKAVWPDVTVTDESLTRCISDVRHALGDERQRIIKTVPRRGDVAAEKCAPRSMRARPDRVMTLRSSPASGF